MIRPISAEARIRYFLIMASVTAPVASAKLSSQAECTNLFVPLCLSASHIAFGSIRMEPVFMVLGESAATAAVQSIDEQAAVQDIDYESLAEQLAADGQVLRWK